jgi:hypothetical protein
MSKICYISKIWFFVILKWRLHEPRPVVI